MFGLALAGYSLTDSGGMLLFVSDRIAYWIQALFFAKTGYGSIHTKQCCGYGFGWILIIWPDQDQYIERRNWIRAAKKGC